MDPTVASTSLVQLGAQQGFNAVLVVVLLLGLWKLIVLFLTELKAHKAERDAAWVAFVDQLDKMDAKHGARIDANTAALTTVGTAQRETVEAVRELGQQLRRVNSQ